MGAWRRSKKVPLHFSTQPACKKGTNIFVPSTNLPRAVCGMLKASLFLYEGNLSFWTMPYSPGLYCKLCSFAS